MKEHLCAQHVLAIAATAGLSAGNLEQNVGVGVGTMILKAKTACYRKSVRPQWYFW